MGTAFSTYVLPQQVVDGLLRFHIAVVQRYAAEVFRVVLKNLQHRLTVSLSAGLLHFVDDRFVHLEQVWSQKAIDTYTCTRGNYDSQKKNHMVDVDGACYGSCK